MYVKQLSVTNEENNACMHSSPFLLGVEPPTKFSKRGGAWQDLNFWRGVCGKERVTFSGGGGCNFYVRDKLKYLMTKKVYKQRYFSLT